ncbi:secretin N-terminal domain-containing protein, partial [Klebsiella pneumoniae]
PLATAGAMPSTRLIAVTSPDIGPLSWQGPLGGLLDTLSTRSGMHWRHEGGQITFFSQTTETFQIAVLNASTSMDASVTGGTSASAGVSGGGSNSNSLSGNQDTSQKTTVRLASELYDDLRKAVETMLT